DFRHAAAFSEPGRIGAEPHGAAKISAEFAPLALVAPQPFGQKSDNRLAARAEFGGIRALDAREIARRLDYRHLHAEADSEIGHAAFAREPRRADFSLRPALAEAARHQNAVHMLEERRGILVLENLGLDPVELDLHLVRDAAVRKRL